MSRFYQFLIVLLCAVAAAGTGGVARADGSVYPNGLHGEEDIVSGIFPGTDAGNCCWMGATAAIRIAVPAGADTLLLNVYLPRFGAPERGQSLRVRIGSALPANRCCFGAGETELAFPLPPGARRGTITVRLQAGSTFVPKAIGLNQDPRHLSLLIRSVSFENASTGERFETGALPWLAPRAALAVLAAAGVIILLLTLRRPIYGAAALILTDPFLLAYNVHGTSITLPKVALIAVAVGLVPRIRLLARERSWSSVSLLAAAQLAFVLTMIASSQHAHFHAAALRETLKAAQYLLTLLAAYAAYRLDPGEEPVRLCLSLVTIAVTVLAFGQTFAGAVQSEIVAGHTFARIAGPLEGPNQLAGFLGITVPAMVAFAILRPQLTIERIAIALGSIACLLTFSRGGIGALLLSIAVLLAIRYNTPLRAWVGAGTLALFAAIIALAFGIFSGAIHGTVQNIFGATGSDSFNGGLGSRVDLWHGAYAMWRSHPVLGIGPGNFEYAIGRIIPGVRTHANGMYFQVLAEQGLIGLAAMIAVVAASVLVFVRRLNQPLMLAACAAAIAMVFHQIVDCMWIYPKVGVIWWILLALGAAVSDAQTAASPALAGFQAEMP